jgi:hypothetical protein
MGVSRALRTRPRRAFADIYRSRAAGLSHCRLALFWCRIAVDTVLGGLAERVNRRRRLPLRVHQARGPSLRATLHHITGLSPMGTQTANLTGVAEPDRLRTGS